MEKLIDVCESLDTANLPTDAASNKRKEYPVDETFSESKTFEKLIKYYANFMVNRIDGAIEMGYDWDVIQKMLRRELPYERFIYLKNEFSAC